MNAARLLLLALLPLAGLLEGARGAAQEGASLAVDPPAQTVALAGGEFGVSVLVDEVAGPDGLGGYTLVMEFDPAVVRAVAVADSGFVGSTDNAVVCPASGIDNDAGRLAQFCLTIPIFLEPGPVTSEPRVLASVTFEPVAVGTTELNIGGSLLTDPQGSGIAASTSGGTVVVRREAADPAAPESSTQGGSSGGEGPERAASGEAGGLPVSGTGPGITSGERWLLVAEGLAGSGGILLLFGGWLRRWRRGGCSR